MSAPAGPLFGYNTNIRHNGALYHAQTEDSGPPHYTITSHLFADGGRVVHTRKREYTAEIAAGWGEAELRKLIQEEHKAILRSVRKLP